MSRPEPIFSDPTTGMSRRKFLQVGYSGLLGMSLPGLLAARATSALASSSTGAPASVAPGIGRAKSVIVILLSGGIGQHDSFDLKPEAPEAIRGEFKPIDTAAPGLRFCEHLQGLASRAKKLAIVRSMAHREGNHLQAVHWTLTGKESVARGATDLDRIASRDDFPCYAAVVDQLRGRSDGVPNGVALPLKMIEGPLTWPGQDAGFLGPRHDPWQLRLDPNKPEARDQTLALPEGLSPERLHRRRHLLGQSSLPSITVGESFNDQQSTALAMLSNGKVGAALNLDLEDPKTLDRYGRHNFGKSLLITRRLVEAGVPIVQAMMGIVQTWDLHVNNYGRLKNDLLPPLDKAVSALLDDLEAKGMLEETLVVMLSEFGRTPKITELTPGAIPGRDHWPKVYSAMFAGAGVVGGQLIGKSDRIGAFPLSRSFAPADLAATIYRALGVDLETELTDRLGRPIRLCAGDPIDSLYTTASI